MMKRWLSILTIAMLLVVQAMPVMAASEEVAKMSAEMPPAPYEKVVASNGSWYTEQIPSEKGADFVVAYQGDYAIDQAAGSAKPEGISFEVREDSVLRGVYLPFAERMKDDVRVTIKDEKGNIYGPYKLEEAPANVIVEMSVDDGETDKKGAGSAQFKDPANYVLSSDSEVVLYKGSYTMGVSSDSGLARTVDTGSMGAFLVKGMNLDGYERYKKQLRELGFTGDPSDILGSESFVPDELKDYEYEPIEKAPKKKAARFTLKEDSMVSSIVMNTINEGKGAKPGTISILDDKGVLIGEFASFGSTLGGVANGTWTIIPNLVLPPGDYSVGMSDPSVLAYDKFGNPQFYVTVEDPPQVRYDFTGTYYVDFDALKVSTLMGPVSNPSSALSLKDFELTVLDKGTTVELIGQYQNIPFSQECTVVEETADRLVAEGTFTADMTALPANAMIGAKFKVVFTKEGGKMAAMSISGTGTYERSASSKKGADFNTYRLKGSGTMGTSDLPPFVMSAIGKAGNAGSVPGPDNAAQAAAGLLFPPLVGLVIYVVQEAMRKESEKPKKYTKAWYKQQNPNMTDEQIGWAMLADAMGNTDEPDSGDAEAGSGDSGGSSDEGGGDDSDSGGGSGESDESGESGSGDEEGYGESEEDGSTGSDDSSGEEGEGEEPESGKEGASTEGAGEGQTQGESTVKTDEQGGESGGKDGGEQAPETPQAPAEPETLTLQTDHTGRTTTYVKDQETGEWVNPDTGGVLDMERYEKDVKPNFEKDKAFVDEQRDKLEKGDTAFDKELRAAAEARKAAEQKQAYLDKLGEKYGTTDEGELKRIIRENQAVEQKSSEEWRNMGDSFEKWENRAKVVGVLADTAVDGLAAVTGPVGGEIRAVYKVTKNIAGTMADKGPSVSSFISGSIKGAADAGTDYIDSAKWKAAATIGGEVFGNAATDGWQGAKEGVIDGVSKVGMGALTDKLGGKGFGNEVSTMNLSGGGVRVAIKSGEKWIGRNLSSDSASKFITNKLVSQGKQSMVKALGGLTDEFGVKPVITEPLKKRV